jgi:Cu/Ag efflux pump CusA
MPELITYFQSGGLVDAVLNLGLAAPIDIPVTGSDLKQTYATAEVIRERVKATSGVSDAFIPQDIDAPALHLAIDGYHADELGFSQKEVVSNVITALTSNGMIAPSYWVDPQTGNDYLLTVQYPDNTIKSLRPILMTSLATIFGLLPMALKLGTGTEAYAPLARAIIGGLLVSVALTVFIVPSAVLIIYRQTAEKSYPARSKAGMIHPLKQR